MTIKKPSTISFRCAANIKDQILELAKRNNVSLGDCIVACMRRGYEQWEKELEEKRNAPKPKIQLFQKKE